MKERSFRTSPSHLSSRTKPDLKSPVRKVAYDQKNELKPLLEHCKPAPFGDGKKTRYDRTVRDALQLKAEKGGFSVENFDPESAGILKEIQRELVPHDPNPISAELYTVNVYTDGGHFAPHKDTPRGNDMFGTLVVCLPSQFTNGTLVLSHRGVVQKFDWGPRLRHNRSRTNFIGPRFSATWIIRSRESGAEHASP